MSRLPSNPVDVAITELRLQAQIRDLEARVAELERIVKELRSSVGA